MKALTICQPYAHLITVTREKRVENRQWSTRYRGDLVIHAGKSLEWLHGERPTDDMVFGAAIGVVSLVDCLHIDEIEDGKHDVRYPWLSNHLHTEGTWCLVLDNVRPFVSPVPWRGGMGLWNFPDAEVQRQAQVIEGVAR